MTEVVRRCGILTRFYRICQTQVSLHKNLNCVNLHIFPTPVSVSTSITSNCFCRLLLFPQMLSTSLPSLRSSFTHLIKSLTTAFDHLHKPHFTDSPAPSKHHIIGEISVYAVRHQECALIEFCSEYGVHLSYRLQDTD